MEKNRIILIIVLLFVFGNVFPQTLVVTDDPAYTIGQPSSVLDVKSNAKGFLAPRMVQTERLAISSPAEGLWVYQTDGAMGFYYYNGIAWLVVAYGTLSNYLPLIGGTLTGILNANSGIKLGTDGTALQKIIKTSVTVTDNTNIKPGTSRTINLTVTGATLNSTVIVNPRTALVNTLGIGYSYVSAANTVTINLICTNGTITLGTKTFDITIIQ